MKKITKENVEREKKRRKMKEGAYTKFTDLSRHMIAKSYYTDFDATLTSFLALNLAAEATKANLMKMGGTAADIESARASIKREIWALIGLDEKNITKELLRRHYLEEERAEKQYLEQEQAKKK